MISLSLFLLVLAFFGLISPLSGMTTSPYFMLGVYSLDENPDDYVSQECCIPLGAIEIALAVNNPSNAYLKASGWVGLMCAELNFTPETILSLPFDITSSFSELRGFSALNDGGISIVWSSFASGYYYLSSQISASLSLDFSSLGGESCLITIMKTAIPGSPFGEFTDGDNGASINNQTKNATETPVDNNNETPKDNNSTQNGTETPVDNNNETPKDNNSTKNGTETPVDNNNETPKDSNSTQNGTETPVDNNKTSNITDNRSQLPNISSGDGNSTTSDENPSDQPTSPNTLLFKIIIIFPWIIGIILTLFGLKHLKFSIFTINTAVVALLVYLILAFLIVKFTDFSLAGTRVILLIVSTIIGAVCGYLAVENKKIAYFIIGLGFGGSLAFTICSLIFPTLHVMAHIIIALSAIVGGILIHSMSERGIIIATAYIGSWTVINVISYYYSGIFFERIVSDTTILFVYLGALVILALSGAIKQVKDSAAKKQKEEEQEGEVEESNHPYELYV